MCVFNITLFTLFVIHYISIIIWVYMLPGRYEVIDRGMRSEPFDNMENITLS